jgi:hypothetical protein
VNDSETISQPVDVYGQTLFAFTNGFGNQQVDEVLSNATTVDDPEGNSTLDFANVLKNSLAIDTLAVLTKNCMPSGGSPAVD